MSVVNPTQRALFVIAFRLDQVLESLNFGVARATSLILYPSLGRMYFGCFLNWRVGGSSVEYEVCDLFVDEISLVLLDLLDPALQGHGRAQELGVNRYFPLLYGSQVGFLVHQLLELLVFRHGLEIPGLEGS